MSLEEGFYKCSRCSLQVFMGQLPCLNPLTNSVAHSRVPTFPRCSHFYCWVCFEDGAFLNVQFLIPGERASFFPSMKVVDEVSEPFAVSSLSINMPINTGKESCSNSKIMGMLLYVLIVFWVLVLRLMHCLVPIYPLQFLIIMFDFVLSPPPQAYMVWYGINGLLTCHAKGIFLFRNANWKQGAFPCFSTSMPCWTSWISGTFLYYYVYCRTKLRMLSPL